MLRSSKVGTFGLLGAVVTALIVLFVRTNGSGRSSREGPLTAALVRASRALDGRLGWHRLPPWVGLAVLVGLRKDLRRHNLHDTSTAPTLPQPAPAPDKRYLTSRSPNGTFNDLEQPAMGSAGTRFGRNAPIDMTFPEPMPDILSPNPRIVSQTLMTRDEFKPATTLNLLAGAWLQF